VLVITGDHGCDPTTASTDHTRERTPLLVAGAAQTQGRIGTREGFEDLGATLCDLFDAPTDAGHGSSFAPELGF
jgi:phosphopentomutase